MPKKRDAKDGLRGVAECFMANLARLVSSGAKHMVTPLRAEHYDLKTRYKRQLVNARRLSDTVLRFENARLIQRDKGRLAKELVPVKHMEGTWEWSRLATEIVITDEALWSRLASIDVSREVEADPDIEPVILRAPLTHGQKEDKKYGQRVTPDTQEYDDTQETGRYRAELAVINEHIAHGQAVEYLGSLNRDVTQVRLERIFNRGSFSKGGRLFGHWAQQLPKYEREHLRINGEPVVVQDFSAMHPGLLYAREGLPAPVEPYAIPGLETRENRAALKIAVAAILNAETVLTRCPTGVRKGLPPDWTWQRLCDALFDRMPVLKAHAWSGIGLELMKTESDILVSILLELVSRGIGFVPLHDAVTVPESKAQQVHAIMLSTYREHTGQDAKVDSKPGDHWRERGVTSVENVKSITSSAA